MLLKRKVNFCGTARRVWLLDSSHPWLAAAACPPPALLHVHAFVAQNTHQTPPWPHTTPASAPQPSLIVNCTTDNEMLGQDNLLDDVLEADGTKLNFEWIKKILA